MPYIEKKYREEVDELIDNLVKKIKEISQNDHIVWPGIINYTITKLIVKFIEDIRYWKIAMITGILENVKQEFYRRVASQYEDKKKEQEGDVY